MPENDKKSPEVDPARAIRASYPPNSKKSKEEAEKGEKKVTRLEGVSAVIVKPSLGKRIREAFTGDGARGIGDYLLFEVALPAIKTTLFDLINQGANRALFGDRGVPGSASRRPGVVDYHQISRNVVNSPQRQVTMTARDRQTHNFDSVTFATRHEADQALRALVDIIDQYDIAAVSDLYELVGVTGSFADDRWGWDNLAGAAVLPTRGGFILDLPQPAAIR